MLHTLHIGINDYRGSDNDLQGCVNDARDLAALFAFADSRKLLLDSAATRAGVLRAVATLLKKLQPHDFGILTFSGHGTYAPDEDGDEDDFRDEALVCQDLQLIYDDEFHGILTAREKTSKLFVVTDSCHSGTVHRFFRGAGHFSGARVRFLPVDRITRVIGQPQRDFRARMARTLPNVIHFSGCRDDEFSYDGQFPYAGRLRPNGAMTYALVETYHSGAVRTFADWFRLLSHKLPSAKYPQTPCCNAAQTALKWTVPRGRS